MRKSEVLVVLPASQLSGEKPISGISTSVKGVVCFLVVVTFPFLGLAQQSAGPVGYLSVQTTANKYLAYANALSAVSNVFGTKAPNLLSKVLNLPETASPSSLLLWAGTNYDVNSPIWTLAAGWSPDVLFPPGQGGMLRLPVSTTINILGEFLTGVLTNTFPPGYSMRSSLVPVSDTVDGLGLSSALLPGDGVLRWDVSAQRWNAFLYRGNLGNWKPSVPSLNVAESCYIVSSNGGEWMRNFSVSSIPPSVSTHTASARPSGTSIIPGTEIIALPDNPVARQIAVSALHRDGMNTKTTSRNRLGEAISKLHISAASPAVALGYVIFANRFGPLNAPITNAIGELCTGLNYQAAIQCSADGINWPSPVGFGTDIDFDGSDGPGYFFGDTYDLPVTGSAWLRLLVWRRGTTWESRFGLRSESGASASVWVDVPSGAGDSPVPPALLSGLPGFRLSEYFSQLVVPRIIGQISDFTVSRGSQITFSAAASGGEPLNYFWQFNGTNIPGVNNSSYVIPSVNSARVGTYSVVVCNLARCVTNSTGGVLSLLGLDTPSTLHLEGPIGRGYRIDVSDDLESPTNWTVWTNIVLQGSPRLLEDTNSGPFGRRFYRAIPQ